MIDQETFAAALEAGLDFEEETHRFSRNGRVLLGVTRTVQVAVEAIRGPDAYRPRFTQFQRDRGRAVHRGIELYLQGRLKWESVHDSVAPRIRAAIVFVRDSRVRILHLERKVWSALGFAGIFDAIGVLPDGRPALIDWKGYVVELEARMQTAAYVAAVRERTGLEIPVRIAVGLGDDEKPKPQRYENDQGADFALFRAGLTLAAKRRELYPPEEKARYVADEPYFG